MKRFALLLSLAAVLACKRSGPGESDEMPPTPSARTPWVEARSTEGVPLLEAPATVLPSPEGSAGVVPPFRARVMRVLVRPGARVAAGEALVEVVMPDVVQAAGAYGSAATRVEAYAKRKAQLEGLKGEGLVRLTDLLEADTKLAEAKADEQTALATLRIAGLQGADAARILAGPATVALRSPIAGIVVEVHVNVGDTREPSGEPLVRVAGEGPSRVEARCSRTWPLAGARYEMVASNGMRYPLTYVSRSPTVDRRDGTIAAWFEPPAGEKLPHGLSGRLLVTVEAAAGVSVVPARAVLLQGGQSFVVVQRGGAHQRYAVEVVASSGAEALVRGISPGELVAADAALAEAPPELRPAPEGKTAGEAKPPADARPEPKAEKKAEPKP